MLHFYIALIYPVLEYTVPVWHTDLTADLSDQLETVQKRALCIIFGGSSFTHHSYESCYFTIICLQRSTGYSFFHKLLHPTSCLHRLLPPKRHNPQMAKLRTVAYDIPFARTNSLKTHFFFMHYIITLNVLPQFAQFIHYPHLCFILLFCISAGAFMRLF